MYRICFIDDDEKFEVPLFHRVFGETFDILAASDYANLTSQIDSRENWRPDLFVLDLYFPSGPVRQRAIEVLKKEPLSLENDNAEIRAAYRNYRKALKRLRDVLDAWSQNSDGGLRLAEKVAADYPKVPIVFYSRKATLEDVVRCLAAKNVWWVERKPTGKDSAETIKLTRSAKQRIAGRFEAVISKANSAQVKHLKESAKVIVEILGEVNRS